MSTANDFATAIQKGLRSHRADNTIKRGLLSAAELSRLREAAVYEETRDSLYQIFSILAP